MRRLAEAYVRSTGADPGDGVPAGLLCEAGHSTPYAFVVGPGTDERTARLERFETGALRDGALPFVKLGPNAPYLTPVFKVAAPRRPGKPGISASKRRSTLESFRTRGHQESYFAEVVALLSRPRLELPGGEVAEGPEGTDALDHAVTHIDGQALKRTPLLAVRTTQGLPGEDPRFNRWFAASPDRLGVYLTKDTPPTRGEQICPLCTTRAVLLPNALSGAGLNLANAV